MLSVRRCLGLSLDSLFGSVDLFVYSGMILHSQWFIQIHTKPKYLVDIKSVLAFLGPLSFYITLIPGSKFKENTLVILIVIRETVLMTLRGELASFYILSFPVRE